MAVAAKLVLLSVVASVLPLALVSAFKTGVQPRDISTNLVRRASPQTSNSIDHWEGPASGNTQVVLGSDALLSGVSHDEANDKVTEAREFGDYTDWPGLCTLSGSSYPSDQVELPDGNGVSWDTETMKAACDENNFCTGFQMGSRSTYGFVASARGLLKGQPPTGGSEHTSEARCFAKKVLTRTLPKTYDNLDCGRAGSASVPLSGSNRFTRPQTVEECKAECELVPTCEAISFTKSHQGGTSRCYGLRALNVDGCWTENTYVTVQYRTQATFSQTTMDCAKRLKCLDKLASTKSEQEFELFRCQCIIGIPVAQADETLCEEWIDCLADQDKFSGDLLLILNELKLSYSKGGGALLQHSIDEDEIGCAHPAVIDPALLECSCLDEVKTACEPREGNKLYECVRLEMCKADPAEICQSWKTNQCSDAEINAALLALQGTQKGERAVLAEVFQGRRQMPENTSELGAAALEESLSGKCASKSTR